MSGRSSSEKLPNDADITSSSERLTYSTVITRSFSQGEFAKDIKEDESTWSLGESAHQSRLLNLCEITVTTHEMFYFLLCGL